jgi:uncharacterized RDD family membrane protein YckC
VTSQQPTRFSLTLKGQAPRGHAPDGGAAFTPAQFAGVPFKRVMAYLIDLVFLAVITAVEWFAFKIIGVLSLGLLTPILLVILALTPLAYHTLLIGGPWSATLGMRIMGIEVRAWNGNRPEILQAGLQTILFYVTVSMITPLILIFALFNQRRRCLHDYLCGTVVINTTPKPDLNTAVRRT